MQNLRTLRQRIRSVQNTQKITRAMQMVAGAKLRRSQEELMAFRPYADRLETMTQRFLAAHPELEHPLLVPVMVRQAHHDRSETVRAEPVEARTEAPAGLVVVTSDTGLCGTYNERLLALTGRFLTEFPSAKVVAIGRKGSRWLNRRNLPRLREVLDWGGRFELERSHLFVDWMKDLFLRGEVSGWAVLYTKFISALQFKPAEAVLFPIERPAISNPVPGTGTVPGTDLKQIVEPGVERFTEELLARSVQARFSRILLEAFTSEHSARMVAMKNATENASQMIDTLTLVRNKARQAAITKELIEVVSGAQALR